MRQANRRRSTLVFTGRPHLRLRLRSTRPAASSPPGDIGEPGPPSGPRSPASALTSPPCWQPWRMRGLPGSAMCAAPTPVLLGSACRQVLGLHATCAVSALLLLAAPPGPLLAAVCAQPKAAGAQGGAGRCAAGAAGGAAAGAQLLSGAMSRPRPAGLAAQACSEMAGAPAALPGASAAGSCAALGACCSLIWRAACSAPQRRAQRACSAAA